MWKKIKMGIYLLIIGTSFTIEIGYAMEVTGNQSGTWKLTEMLN